MLRFAAACLTWPPPDDVTDAVLEARLFGKSSNGSQHGRQRRIAFSQWGIYRYFKELDL
jgi:hypothetical protein